jgi:hypothetical protein
VVTNSTACSYFALLHETGALWHVTKYTFALAGCTAYNRQWQTAAACIFTITLPADVRKAMAAAFIEFNSLSSMTGEEML